MEAILICSICDAPATLLCICSNTRVCKGCTVRHLSQTQRVHTFVSVSNVAYLESGDSQLTVVRRSQLVSSVQDFLKSQLDQIETFKQSCLDSLQKTALKISSKLAKSTDMKLEALTRDSETAKREALKYLDSITNSQLNTINLDANSLFANMRKKYSGLGKVDVFEHRYSEAEYESALQNFAIAKVNLNTYLMLEINRDSH